ncbi:hypothetical protein WR25_12557 [Diploscapter pachys]|uniref:RNA polymerase II elongation factor ELL N-terminal domain-containing protein n=1 Tax=Diploscapter pachys TaxID=2018661 RepID=A0A2A2KUB5_9BILA|nr:hypothetical protein WR25_12557 [Diploscapter pachys]
MKWSSSTHSLSHTIDPLRHELQKTPLRKRVIHLIATGQHRSWKEVYTRLEEDGLSDEQKSKSRIESMIGELSDLQQLPNRSPKLALKPSLYNELDMRWKWFNEDEKATVRRLVSSGKAHTSASEEAFAPVRKSHVERIQAGSRSDKQQSRVVSPESIPTPPSGQTGHSGNKQPGPSTTHLAPQTTTTVDKDPLGAILALSDPVLDSDYTSPTSQNKRKAHVASAAVASSNSAPAAKRPRPESASPPEDPTIVDKEKHVQKQHQQQQVEKEKLSKTTVTSQRKKKQPVAPASVSGGSSSSSSSRTQSPAFFSSPPEPSRDWDKVFQEVGFNIAFILE